MHRCGMRLPPPTLTGSHPGSACRPLPLDRTRLARLRRVSSHPTQSLGSLSSQARSYTGLATAWVRSSRRDPVLCRLVCLRYTDLSQVHRTLVEAAFSPVVDNYHPKLVLVGFKLIFDVEQACMHRHITSSTSDRGLTTAQHCFQLASHSGQVAPVPTDEASTTSYRPLQSSNGHSTMVSPRSAPVMLRTPLLWL